SRAGRGPGWRPPLLIGGFAAEYSFRQVGCRGAAMKIGVIGSGEVARTLAAGFLKHGHEVMLGTRSPEKLKSWTSQHSNARIGSFAEVAAFGAVVVLAVKGATAVDALTPARTQISGKTVIDAPNP